MKKVYVEGTAAVLRARGLCDEDGWRSVQENAEDILAEAKQINEKRAAEEEACCTGRYCSRMMQILKQRKCN